MTQAMSLPLKRIPYLWIVDHSQPMPHPDGKGKFRGYFNVVRRTYAHQGTLSFWKGASICLASAAIKMIGMRELITRACGVMDNRLQRFAVSQDGRKSPTLGFIISSATRFTITFGVLAMAFPMEYLYLRFAVQRENKTETCQFKNFRRVIKQTYAQNGIRGFFRGLWPTFLGLMGYRAAYFFLYDTTRDVIDRMQQTGNYDYAHVLFTRFIVAQTCTLLAMISVVPLEVVSKRLMMQNCRPDPQFLSMTEGLNYIYKNEGLKNLYRGGLFKSLSAFGSATVLVGYDSIMSKRQSR